jgi:hypothetical protein
VTTPQDAILFVARPGTRLWKANLQGVVQATYMLKNTVPPSLNEGVHLLPEITKSQKIVDEDIHLGCLFLYDSTRLFTYHNHGGYVIDPGLGTIVAHHRNIGAIVDVAVNDTEVVILRHGHDRPILRLGQQADTQLGKCYLTLH